MTLSRTDLFVIQSTLHDKGFKAQKQDQMVFIFSLHLNVTLIKNDKTPSNNQHKHDILSKHWSLTNIQQMHCNVACFTEISDEKSMRTITANEGLWTNFCPPSLIFIKFWMTSFKKSNLNKTVYLLTENVYHFDLRLLIIFRKLFFFLKNLTKMG